MSIHLCRRIKTKVAAGTLYGAIENLLKQKLIVEVKSEDKRRRVYKLTPEGNELLKHEIERLKHLISISENLVLGGN